MHYLGVELEPVVAPLDIRHDGHRGVLGGCQRREPGRHCLDAVPVAHPDIQLGGKSGQQWRAPRGGDGRRPELALATRPPPCLPAAPPAAASRSRCPAPAARTRTPSPRRAAPPRRTRCSARREDKAAYIKVVERGRLRVVGDDFAVGVQLADAPRDQHAVLRAEVNDDDGGVRRTRDGYVFASVRVSANSAQRSVSGS